MHRGRPERTLESASTFASAADGSIPHLTRQVAAQPQEFDIARTPQRCTPNYGKPTAAPPGVERTVEGCSTWSNDFSAKWPDYLLVVLSSDFSGNGRRCPYSRRS